VLCGDFNLQAHEPEYAALAAALADEEGATAGQAGQPPLWDAWRLMHPGAPQPPTFCVFDQTYAPQPLACDFIWVSESLRSRVRAVRVDGVTQASDHQPVLLELE